MPRIASPSMKPKRKRVRGAPVFRQRKRRQRLKTLARGTAAAISGTSL